MSLLLPLAVCLVTWSIIRRTRCHRYLFGVGERIGKRVREAVARRLKLPEAGT